MLQTCILEKRLRRKFIARIELELQEKLQRYFYINHTRYLLITHVTVVINLVSSPMQHLWKKNRNKKLLKQTEVLIQKVLHSTYKRWNLTITTLRLPDSCKWRKLHKVQNLLLKLLMKRENICVLFVAGNRKLIDLEWLQSLCYCLVRPLVCLRTLHRSTLQTLVTFLDSHHPPQTSAPLTKDKVRRQARLENTTHLPATSVLKLPGCLLKFKDL